MLTYVCNERENIQIKGLEMNTPYIKNELRNKLIEASLNDFEKGTDRIGDIIVSMRKFDLHQVHEYFKYSANHDIPGMVVEMQMMWERFLSENRIPFLDSIPERRIEHPITKEHYSLIVNRCQDVITVRKNLKLTKLAEKAKRNF